MQKLNPKPSLHQINSHSNFSLPSHKETTENTPTVIGEDNLNSYTQLNLYQHHRRPLQTKLMKIGAAQLWKSANLQLQPQI